MYFLLPTRRYLLSNKKVMSSHVLLTALASLFSFSSLLCIRNVNVSKVVGAVLQQRRENKRRKSQMI